MLGFDVNTVLLLLPLMLQPHDHLVHVEKIVISKLVTLVSPGISDYVKTAQRGVAVTGT